MMTAMPAPRRSPAPDERRRDAERSRARLLDAAMHEFAAKGYAGARVADIAARAGVNKQLISYYFGGKEGLFLALHKRWTDREDAFAAPDVPLDEVVARYLHETNANPCPIRMMVWQSMSAGDGPELPDRDLPMMRHRRASGELADDLDPGATLVALMGMVMAPVVVPAVARRMIGAEPGSPEFEQRYAEQLRRIVRKLRPASDAPETSPPAE